MKYIRTKDGKIIKDGVYERKRGYEILVADINKVKEADTIEELINRYITITKGHYKIMTRHRFESENIRTIKKWLSNGVIIYGAIWTKEGLVYAAKMNEVGEWELL